MPRSSIHDDALQVDLAGVALRNPVMLAAGTAGYGDEMGDALNLSQLGAVVTKSITREARDGNETWRIIESRRAMLNAIGLANVGAEAFERDHIPRLEQSGASLIGSVAGSSIQEYVEVGAMMDRHHGIRAVELNVSCPNVHDGASFGESPGLLAELISEVAQAVSSKPLFVKLPPLITGLTGSGIVDVARASVDAGANGLTVGNTYPAMAIDVETKAPRLSNVTGGLSGPAIHPVTLRLVHLVYREVARDAGVPIIGAGGVMNWEDAAEFMLAGASAIEMGTALFVDPRSPLRVIDGLSKWVRRQRVSSVRELVGAVRLSGTAG